MNVKEFYLNSCLPETLNVALIQISSPFPDDVQITYGENHGAVFAINEVTRASYRKRINQLKATFRAIGEKAKDLHLIVLPEYAFLKFDAFALGENEETFDFLTTFAQNSGTIVMGNYYDPRRRASVSFVIIPSTLIRDQETSQPTPVILEHAKYTITAYDARVLRDLNSRLDMPNEIIRLWWKPQSQSSEAYIQLLTCKDYLYFTSAKSLREWPNVIKLDAPGIIVCPMCTPEIKTFETRALSLVRDAVLDSGEKSIISCFCNATSLAHQTAPNIVGETQFVCPIDPKHTAKPLLPKGNEGVLIAALSPYKAIRVPTPTNQIEANAVLTAVSTFTIAANKSQVQLIDTTNRRTHTGLVVHPHVLYDLGYKKVYGFIRTSSYHSLRSLLQLRFNQFPELSIAVTGIFGVHDILACSWEDFYEDANGCELLQTRLWPAIIDPRDLDREHFGFCVVKNIIKFRGCVLSKHAYDQINIREQNGGDFRRHLRKAVLGRLESNDPSNDTMQRDGILIESRYDVSDLSDDDKAAGSIEYLILVKLICDDPLHASNSRDYFEQVVLPELCADERIRTIEQIATSGNGYLDYDYLLHMVGDLQDLTQVVVGQIHTPPAASTNGKHLKFGTRVVIPAEPVSYQALPGLLEPPKVKAREPNHISLIKDWKRMESNSERRLNQIQPCIVNLLSEEMARGVFQASYLSEVLGQKLGFTSGGWAKEALEFLYGICIASCGHMTTNATAESESISRMLRPFVVDLATQIESHVARNYKYLAEVCQITEQQLEEFLNVSCLIVQRRDDRKLSIKKPELGTAAVVVQTLGALLFNEKVKKQLPEMAEQHFKGDATKVVAFEKVLNALNQRFAGLDQQRFEARARELRTFSETRNAFAHGEHDSQLDPCAVLNGVLTGLRVLDAAVKWLGRPRSTQQANH